MERADALRVVDWRVRDGVGGEVVTLTEEACRVMALLLEVIEVPLSKRMLALEERLRVPFCSCKLPWT